MNQHTRNIIVDSLILVAFSSILGGISLVVSKSFSGDPNPALDLITVMKKAEAKEVNASSEQEEQEARVKGMKEFDQTLEEGEQLACALPGTPAGRPPRGNRPEGQGRMDRSALGFLERAGPLVRHAD